MTRTWVKCQSIPTWLCHANFLAMTIPQEHNEEEDVDEVPINPELLEMFNSAG